MSTSASGVWVRSLSIVALVFLGLGGLLGGVSGMMDPVAPLGVPPEFIQRSPFPDYFFPALILLVVNGVAPLVLAVALWRRHPLAPLGLLAQGVALMGWILVQVLLLRLFVPPLHGTCLLLGAGLVVLGLQQLPRRQSASPA